jgi:hypothetical protein
LVLGDTDMGFARSAACAAVLAYVGLTAACDTDFSDLIPDKNQPPTACFKVTSKVPNGANHYKVSFDATESRDDSNIIQYVWDFGDATGPVTLTPAQSGNQPTHDYFIGNGAVTVSLRARDDDGILSEPFYQRFQLSPNAPPVGAFAINPDPARGSAPLLVTVDASASTDPDPDDQGTLTFSWD